MGDTSTIQGKELYELEVRIKQIPTLSHTVKYTSKSALQTSFCLSLSKAINHVSQPLLSINFVLQVMLRVKESEVQYLKQEINSLKDELQAAQRVSFALFFLPFSLQS